MEEETYDHMGHIPRTTNNCVHKAKHILTLRSITTYNCDRTFEYIISGKSYYDYSKCPNNGIIVIGYRKILCEEVVTMKSEIKGILKVSVSEA